ncbi:MAG: VCBS repeat-containing protein, partial [Verrucomicrobiales bacterium]|nr:VCBS repeat-containing protein [Verrucomicrobiales bacterium]
DIICGGFWYENPGNNSDSWTKHFVREVAELGGRYDGYSHLPYDIDGDGDTDFINVNYRSKSIYWVEHPADLSQPWPKHIIGLPGAMETGHLHDIDGDGHLDILPNGARFAAWWHCRPEKLENGNTFAKFHKIDFPEEVAGHGIGYGDVNGDGRADVIGIKGWLEAPQDRLAGEWKWHADFTLPHKASVPIIVADPDGDGDNDLIWSNAHGYGVFWEEQTAPGTFDHRVIDRSWSQGHTPIWIDLDEDGISEFVCGKRYYAHDGKDPGAEDIKTIHRYQFDVEAGMWRRGTISKSDSIGFGLGPAAGDVDGDGDIDLVCPGRSGLYWLENGLK